MITEILLSILLFLSPIMCTYGFSNCISDEQFLGVSEDELILNENIYQFHELKTFLKHSKVDKNNYSYVYNHTTLSNNGFWCENFTRELTCELNKNNFNSHKVELSDTNKVSHAIVGVYIHDKIIFVEPQSDNIMFIDDLYEKYDLSCMTIYKYNNKSKDIIYPLNYEHFIHCDFNGFKIDKLNLLYNNSFWRY